MSGIADAAAERIEADGFQERTTLIRKNSKKCTCRSVATSLSPRRSALFCFDTENIIEFVAEASLPGHTS